ncbi:hypothetical protein [Solicola gregarius]|uniref:Uncharacterized protein n=1 Tax=Solicola gregarius TaxID=2908642 RepID=A0AA46TJ72_9ACTN|nr:hypothetical protein [Solicola gregarius]UYM06322.1 hypothetical protein L0C25_04380 [Solicola gregarius]
MASNEERKRCIVRRLIATAVTTVCAVSLGGAAVGEEHVGTDGPSIDVEIESNPVDGSDDGSTDTTGDADTGTTGPTIPDCVVENMPGVGCGGIDPNQEPDGGPELPPVNPADLGESVLDTMYLPSPKVSISPGPPNPTYVNLWTWFWIPESQWVPKSKSVTLRGTTVTVTVKPETATWDSGEGTTTCAGPGEQWVEGSPEESSCGHRYESTGSMNVSASIGWHATWTCSGICIADGGDLGVLEADAGSAQLEVRQRQSMVID